MLRFSLPTLTSVKTENMNTQPHVANENEYTNEDKISVPKKNFVNYNNQNFKIHKIIKVGTYNVTTLATVGKLDKLCSTAKKYDIDFIAIQEHRFPTELAINTINCNNQPYSFIYASASENKIGGVGILIRKKYMKAIKNVNKVSERILEVTIDANPALTIITIYAPTNTTPKEIREDFFDKLQTHRESIPKNNLLLIAGDFNAQIGKDSHQNSPSIIGPNTFHEKTNANGKLLVNLCEAASLRPSIFKFIHSKGRQWTRTKLTEKKEDAKTQIDHILINKKWYTSVNNCRAYSTGG